MPAAPISLLRSPRGLASLILAASIAAIGGAWTYERLGYLPCELCYKERVPYYAAFLLAPASALAAQRGLLALARGAFLLMALLFVGDVALSTYHSGVEWKIFAGPSDCSGALTKRRQSRISCNNCAGLRLYAATNPICGSWA